MMWLFLKQYRKQLVLCAIPIIAAAAFFGYRYVHAQSNQNEAYAVNDQMQSLLDEVGGSVPAPTASKGIETPPPEAGAEPAPTSIITDSAAKSYAKGPKTSSKPKPIIKPIHTSRPKAAAKPKAAPTPTSTPAPTPKTTVKLEGIVKPDASQNPNYRLNLNKATLEELMALPQIGESKAKAIIAYREQINGFKTLEELVAVKGIGPKIFDKIKDHLEL